MIYIGSDHAGYELKGALVSFLNDQGYEVKDMGAPELNESDDYPDYIFPVAEAVSRDPVTHKGIVLGGSGQGEAIAANKVDGIRACVWYGGDMDILRLSRAHNDSNILSLGARFLEATSAKEAVKLWLTTPFSEDERHMRRLEKIKNHE